MIIPSVSSEPGRPIKLTLSKTPGGSDPKDYLPMYLLGGVVHIQKKG